MLLIGAVLAAATLFIFFRPAAYLALLALPLLLLTFVFTCYLERQASAEVLRSTDPLVMSQEEVAMNVQYAGIYTMMAMLLLFTVATLIMAATMVKDWSLVGLVAVVMFVLSAVMVFPYIPLFLAGAEQDQEDRHDRASNEASNREDPQ